MRPMMKNRVFVFGAVTIWAATLSACAGTSVDSVELVPDLRSFTWEELSAADQAQLVQDVETLREQYEVGDDVPTPDVVRVVSMAAHPETQAQCLRERGLDAEPDPIELGVRLTYDESQEVAVKAAMFECEGMYPIRPDQYHGMSDEVVERAYIYDTVTTPECLKERGFEVPTNPPSLEVWKLTGEWEEISDIYYSSALTRDEKHELRLACPLGAPPEVLYLMPKSE